MKKIITTIAKFKEVFASKKMGVSFCNIAEGTHAGKITMIAAEDIERANLIVKAGENENEFNIASASDRPIGVCDDQGSEGDVLNVIVAGAAESTLLCVCSSGANYGDVLYTAANGKVSTVAADGAYKIGVALCSCAANGIVEVDSQGFGSKAWQIFDCGVFDWTGSTTTSTLTNAVVKAEDIVFASIAKVGGSEKYVTANPSNGSIAFTLDTAGTATSTKIAWLIVRKN